VQIYEIKWKKAGQNAPMMNSNVEPTVQVPLTTRYRSLHMMSSLLTL
jgi:hypothetical protein